MSAPHPFRTDWVLCGETIASTLGLYTFVQDSSLTLPLPDHMAARHGSHLALVRMVGYADHGERTGCFVGSVPLVCIARTITLEKWNGKREYDSEPGL